MPAEIKGLIELQKALKDYAPALAVQLDDQMAVALGGVVKKAQEHVPPDSPLSGWSYRRRSEFYFDAQDNKLRKFPLFNAATIVKNIKYSSTESFRSVLGWSQR